MYVHYSQLEWKEDHGNSPGDEVETTVQILDELSSFVSILWQTVER